MYYMIPFIKVQEQLIYDDRHLRILILLARDGKLFFLLFLFFIEKRNGGTFWDDGNILYLDLDVCIC